MKRIFLRWFPWKHVVRRFAQAYGFIDPILLLSRVSQFAQPSEVQQPLELLRAGIVFHARGLVNTQAIQYNLDWVWPYWVNRQFNPGDESFLPRAFSVTHINLTHRNWTAFGLPEMEEYPIVDPAGLLTPFWDSWSLDVWLFDVEGRTLIPARRTDTKQTVSFEAGITIASRTSESGLELDCRSFAQAEDGEVSCILSVRGCAREDAILAFAVRPYNPEGISFVERIEAAGGKLIVNGEDEIRFSKIPDRVLLSDYRGGDVYPRMPYQNLETTVEVPTRIKDEVGMATAAALFKLPAGKTAEVAAEIPLKARTSRGWQKTKRLKKRAMPANWKDALTGTAVLNVSDPQYLLLYEAAVRTVILHAPGDVFPGPFTYKRFWFRDAAFILAALLSIGATTRAGKCLELFPSRQTKHGYFLSQEGEWDSNGEALWVLERYYATSGTTASPEMLKAIRAAAVWIKRKRLRDSIHSPHAGLFPPGFSAEHLGPSDYYYWDNFWGIAGLEAAMRIFERAGWKHEAEVCRSEALDFRLAVEASIRATVPHKLSGAVPASPYRRMDAGAVGSLAASYPLRLWPPENREGRATADFLIQHSFFDGAFFQEMIHSGLNAYLSLHIAQVLLRGGDRRFIEIADRVAQLASSTGQWPEAVHPRTGGGCMGDGQHVWAAAEWIMLVVNMFVQEEENYLLLFPGIPDRWLDQGRISFGPVCTRFGKLNLCADKIEGKLVYRWEGEWIGMEPKLYLRDTSGRRMTLAGAKGEFAAKGQGGA